MKKWITFILTLSMALCLLAGCGGGDEKSAAQTSQSAPKEKEVSDGYWVVEKMEMEGTEFSGEDMTGIFGPADSIMALAFDGEGSFDAVLFEDFLKGTYSGTNDALELDFAGEIVKGTCTEDTLVLDMKDGSFTLKRQDEMPDMLTNNPWVSYAHDFDAKQTASMSNFMSYGSYLIEDGVLYGLTHSQSLNGGDLQTVVDKEIYYPYFICSDWMIFQDDADDESLHLYNTAHGTELNITYVPSYNPILDGHYLYYADSTQEGYFLCRIDMRDPDTFLFEGSELPLRESTFMIDDKFFYTTNHNSVAKEDWKELTDTSDATEEIEVYVSEDYTVYHELDSDGAIIGKYVTSKKEGGGSSFL